MQLPSGIQIPADQIAATCERWGINRLELFGSALTDKFNFTSDIDLLVTFNSEDSLGLAYIDMETDFAKIFARKVDVISKKALISSRNKFRANKIISAAISIYDRA